MRGRQSIKIGIWRLGAIALGLVLWLSGAHQAIAQCAVNQVTITTSGASLPVYNPFAAQVITPVTVSVRNISGNTCDLALSFPSSNVNQATMTNGAGSNLNYIIENANNNKIIFYTGAFPTSGTDRVNINNLGSGQTRNVTVDVSTLAGQVVADGTYQDLAMQAHVFNRNGTTLTLIRTASFPVTQTVMKICRLNPPSTTAMNFTSAITNGRPNPASTQSSTFSSVQCTAPTIVRLSGAALQPLAPIAPRAGFDNTIGWRAVGTFGSATATLNATSTTTTTADSALRNVISGATTSGTINLTVNLLDSGQPIQAGSYSSVLTVTIDPTL